MNHDLIHCDGLECPLKEKCVRYKAHLELKGKRNVYFHEYFAFSPYNSKTKQCKQIKTE